MTETDWPMGETSLCPFCGGFAALFAEQLAAPSVD
jgi:hypothetical protein